MIPRNSGGSARPSMVKVFPHPVWPSGDNTHAYPPSAPTPSRTRFATDEVQEHARGQYNNASLPTSETYTQKWCRCNPQSRTLPMGRQYRRTLSVADYHHRICTRGSKTLTTKFMPPHTVFMNTCINGMSHIPYAGVDDSYQCCKQNPYT
jgi:hypothetical protein